MRVVAAIQANLGTTSLGTRSRLTDPLDGVPVLRRTIERVARVDRITDVHVLCPPSQEENCQRIVDGTIARVHTIDGNPPTWASLVQAARKWSLDGWRGGIGGTTAFDEFVDARAVSALLGVVDADAVLAVPPAAPLLNVALANRMIEHHERNHEDSRVTFTEAAPGVAGIVLSRVLVNELAEKGIPIGWVFSYKPDTPQKDLVFESCCCSIPAALRYAAGRLIADTDRSSQRVAALLRDHAEPDLTTMGEWLAARERDATEPMPREVEIELTTDDPYPFDTLRPRGERVAKRGPLEVGIVESVCRELLAYDDSLVVLGGFGDPLRHPDFEHILDVLRPAGGGKPGVYGLNVRTSAVDLDERRAAALVVSGVDVLTVTLDAWTADLYGQLRSPTDPAAAPLDRVLRNLEHLSAARERAQSPRPIIVPEMTKARDNVHELDDFFDGWMRRFGSASITGHCHYAGQIEDRSVMQMAPSVRAPCRRLRSRCIVLADGSVSICDQDVRGLHTLGNLREQTLESIWLGPAFESLRDAHRRGRHDAHPLCRACDEWHRA